MPINKSQFSSSKCGEQANCQDSLTAPTCKTGPHCTQDTYTNCTINYNCNMPPEPCPPEKDEVLAFLSDGNLSYKMTAPGNIQLLLDDTELDEMGGFSVTTTQVTNDTFNFPSTGIYQVTIQINYDFLPPNQATLGTPYQVVVNVNTNAPQFIPAMAINTGLASTGTNSDTFTRSFLLNVVNPITSFTLELISFNFDLAFDKSISFSSPQITAIKLTDKNFS